MQYVVVPQTEVVDHERLANYLRRHAHRGRFAAPEGGGGANRGGRPLGSGRFHTRVECVRELRAAYAKARREVEGWREVGMTDLGKVLRVPRSSIYWWFSRFNITMADLV